MSSFWSTCPGLSYPLDMSHPSSVMRSESREGSTFWLFNRTHSCLFHIPSSWATFDHANCKPGNDHSGQDFCSTRSSAPTYPPLLLGPSPSSTRGSQAGSARTAPRGPPEATCSPDPAPSPPTRARSLHPKPTCPRSALRPRIRPPPPGSAPAGSGACAVNAAGRSLCPRRRPARERNGGGGEVGEGDRRGLARTPGRSETPSSRLGPAAPVRSVDAQALPEPPLALHPRPGFAGLPWGLRGAGISGSLGSRDR